MVALGKLRKLKSLLGWAGCCSNVLNGEQPSEKENCRWKFLLLLFASLLEGLANPTGKWAARPSSVPDSETASTS